MRGKQKLAVAIMALSIAAAGGGIGATGAQAQSSELLQGTATTTGGASGLCLSSSRDANAYFNVAGTATGPYQGKFTETNAKASLLGSKLTLSIPFTISSGTTTITGTITNPAPYTGGSALCGPSFYIFGIGVATTGATYTATIQRPRLPAQTISGNTQINGGFQFRPSGRQTTITETLTFP